jgi:hypothetical protein
LDCFRSIQLCFSGLRAALTGALTVLAFIAISEAATTERDFDGLPPPQLLVVRSSGMLPGFDGGNIALYLAHQMTQAPLLGWSFEPDLGDTSPRANRIEWRFRVEPGTPQTPAAGRRFVPRRMVTIEVRLFLNDQFQTVTFGQVDIYGGPQDSELAAFIINQTASLLDNPRALRALERRAP